MYGQYKSINGQKYAVILNVSVSQAFDLGINLQNKRIVQYDNPSQNYVIAHEIIANLCSRLVPILAWTSNINPIETLSCLVDALVKDTKMKKL